MKKLMVILLFAGVSVNVSAEQTQAEKDTRKHFNTTIKNSKCLQGLKNQYTGVCDVKTIDGNKATVVKGQGIVDISDDKKNRAIITVNKGAGNIKVESSSNKTIQGKTFNK